MDIGHNAFLRHERGSTHRVRIISGIPYITFDNATRRLYEGLTYRGMRTTRFYINLHNKRVYLDLVGNHET